MPLLKNSAVPSPSPLSPAGRIRTLALGTALAGLVLQAVSLPACAHAHLKVAQPAADSVASAPSVLEIRFTEGVEPAFSGVDVSGPLSSSGTGPAVSARVAVDPQDKTRLTVTPAAPLAAGRYMVKWHVTATDGHKTQGTYTFTVK